MNTEQQRKKFEEWATSNESIGLDLDIDKNTNHYCDISTYAAWEAWQAARETIATVEETNHREFEEWLATIKYDNSNILSPSNLAWEAWQAARERQWMPIESAPKDTPILASDQFGVTSVVYWRDVSSSHLPRYAWSSHYDNEYMHHVEAFPTHWMPLPNSPTSEKI
jgi:hypothetical protein